MSKRLQVLIDESEYKKFSKQARSERKSLGQWVRESLRNSLSRSVGASSEEKMSRVRELAQKSSYPTADIEQLLSEIEAGYHSGLR